MNAADTTTIQHIYSYINQAQNLVRVLSRGGNNTAARWLADEISTIELDLKSSGQNEDKLNAVLEHVTKALLTADTIELDLADAPGTPAVKKRIGRPRKNPGFPPTPIRAIAPIAQIAILPACAEATGLLKEKANLCPDDTTIDLWRLI